MRVRCRQLIHQGLLVLVMMPGITLFVSCFGAHTDKGIKAPASVVPMQTKNGITGENRTMVAVPETGLAPIANNDQSEFNRKILANCQALPAINPDDYVGGAIYNARPDAQSNIAQALSATRELFKNLRTGIQPSSLSKSKRFLDHFLSQHQEDFRLIQLLRILDHRRESDQEITLVIRLLSTKSSTILELTLARSPITKIWEPIDVQGDPSLLSESEESRYTDYQPQDIERSLIHEGNGKPWL